ncbi:2-hydroxyacid dehydrogenase [Daejeonella sp.]|jgi:D-lactate dehydrogenase|uniref:2-hydroxyacid dehydrogenase n=1 Tax=Daejeonella sp. TaxID=2805397 RepID=UPI0037836C88
MKVVAYSIKEFEKEFLVRANKKQHDITLISNSLSLDTVMYAEGKEAVVVFTNDDVSEAVINKLADLGIKYITTRSLETDHIDRKAASLRQMKVANVPSYSPESIAEYAVMLALSLSRKIVSTVNSSREFDFRIDHHIGFNFYGKTVGIIGLGNVGKATAAIFKGMGCRVIAYDINYPESFEGVEKTSLDKILSDSDIISLHVPISSDTRHIINYQSLNKMKDGVMLINTGSGELIKSSDVLHALKSRKIAYLGLDGYEFEKNLFFSDHRSDAKKDNVLEQLLSFPNVIISPHQAFLTKEALQEIANITIKNLDNWHAGKCSGKACACYEGCKKALG